MQVTEVSVQTTRSLPGYNNISAGLKATIDPNDNLTKAENKLFCECNAILDSEVKRREEKEKKDSELQQAIMTCRSHGLDVNADDEEMGF